MSAGEGDLVHTELASANWPNELFETDSVYVIAEIGNNHNGSLHLAKRLVDASVTAGADAVKFQIRNMEALYRRRPDTNSEDLGVEYIQDLLARVELTLDQHRELRDYCREREIDYVCTPWDLPSVDVLGTFDVAAVKIASVDLCNPELIGYAAKLGKPMILSTGMSTESEIVSAVEQMEGLGVPYAMLHCNSTYPAPERDIQLGYIKRLQQLHPHVGYSGHERGIAISLAAVALGARIVERHITFDRGMEGSDHLASLEPDEFGDLVAGIRQLELALPWRDLGRRISQGERLNRENLGKSLVASCEVAQGTVLTKQMLQIASPGQGLAPYRLDELLGRAAVRSLADGDFFFESDLLEPELRAELGFDVPIRWGIPVRYHDFRDYERRVRPDLYEFHLSYRDLAKDPSQYLAHVDCSRLVVHSPELFEHAELLDLAAEDRAYRARSIDNLQRVIEATLRIRECFPRAEDTLIVVNVGGFSADRPLRPEQCPALYKRFHDSLAKIDIGSTELIPQNMPPFPWHLGGQRHHNIFMLPEDLVAQAQSHGFRYALDVSHLSMTCAHFGLDFQEALAALLPYTAHLHLGDAVGVNGEGVDIGSGDIDWSATWTQIRKHSEISFVPEVWQGHKDHGAGFWSAMRFLESLDGAHA